MESKTEPVNASSENLSAYGLYIVINDETIKEGKQHLAERPAGRCTEVVIDYNGRKIEMTYDEFLHRVGLKESQ